MVYRHIQIALQQEQDFYPKGNNVMDKNRIYIEMIALSLPFIRNIQTLDKQERCADKSCYLEAELIHNLPFNSSGTSLNNSFMYSICLL